MVIFPGSVGALEPVKWLIVLSPNPNGQSSADLRYYSYVLFVIVTNSQWRYLNYLSGKHAQMIRLEINAVFVVFMLSVT